MSSRGPPLFPDTTNAGIVVHPRTLERVIPQPSEQTDRACANPLVAVVRAKHSQCSVRKEIRIRPGFTPVEDVAVFRSQRQQQAAGGAQSKGQVPGWTPPTDFPKLTPKAAAAKPGAGSSTEPTTKAASKNAKRAEKRKEKRIVDQAEFVRQNLGLDEKPATDKSVDDLADKLKSTTVD
ncbi:hypothetical protein BKA62DRAFT_706067 [Auriculariales sp. MPI-PUGE-AT-0066]|nr:hypothetical protein BKA62DRAFT_706067 [Auriculariales sp. MPI-PUGE-AT-0066]